MKKTILLLGSFCFTIALFAQKIDRYALVNRHNVLIRQWDSLSSLTVGNGRFAFTVDITGLQSFPQQYKNGISLGTQAEWGWHAFTDTIGLKRDWSLKTYVLNGKPTSYMVQRNDTPINKKASDWFRQNPHRLQLGNIGFRFIKKDGSIALIDDVQNVHQILNLWKGEVQSDFTIEGVPVHVITFCDPNKDNIGVRVQSKILLEGRLQLFIRFPYPTGTWNDEGVLYAMQHAHQSNLIEQDDQHLTLLHQLDTTKYFVDLHFSNKTNIDGNVATNEKHQFIFNPSKHSDQWECQIAFQQKRTNSSISSFSKLLASNEKAWSQFWHTTGVVDFSGSKDPRAKELERRVVLSQYLMHVQEAGILPPQETGLVNNSWFGKPHLEMTWWHLAHNGQWNQSKVLENILDWYASVKEHAKSIAKRQGFVGARWQKMTDPDGEEVPSSVGAFLIWQQAHPIYFAEQLYRAHPNKATLEKYKELVFMTADFMQSYAQFDALHNRYNLGKGLIPAQERYQPESTFNPTYELVYWKWALQVAQNWRQRLSMPSNPRWQNVIEQIATLPIEVDKINNEKKYLFAESAMDSYTNPYLKTDHPSVLAAYGVMPFTGQIDVSTMQNTFDWIWSNWDWKDTWGWDFPMTAMTATRLGDPEKAIDALLMPIKTNTYLLNGHNYQDNRLRLYLPGNGGLLMAVAMMVAGYDGAKNPMPGIPKNKNWQLRFEGINKLP